MGIHAREKLIIRQFSIVRNKRISRIFFNKQEINTRQKKMSHEKNYSGIGLSSSAKSICQLTDFNIRSTIRIIMSFPYVSSGSMVTIRMSHTVVPWDHFSQPLAPAYP
jgi:hypothetical protein